MAVKNLRFEVPRAGFRRSMPFNRFFIERVDSLAITHFGLVSGSGILLAHFACSIFKAELEMQRHSVFSDYLGKVGSLGDAPPQWQPPSVIQEIAVFNFINVTSGTELAETALCNVAARAVFDAKEGKAAVEMDPIILLRSPRELQKHWIKEIYA